LKENSTNALISNNLIKMNYNLLYSGQGWYKPGHLYKSYYPFHLPQYYTNMHPSFKNKYYRSLFYPRSVHSRFEQPIRSVNATLKQTFVVDKNDDLNINLIWLITLAAAILYLL
jgi:hypothetical protein